MSIRNLKLESIENIIKVLSDVTLYKKWYIRENYEKYNMYFDDNLSFLSKLGLVREVGDELFLSKNAISNKDDFRQYIIVNILSDRLKYCEFWDFIDKFKFDNGSILLHPKTSDMIKYVSVREFLFDLGLIYFDNLNYYINEKYYSYINKKEVLSPQELKTIINRKEFIGINAEKAIIIYENFMLSTYKEFKNSVKIDHISNSDVNAGYDIISFDKEYANMGIYKKIYIEVKAISLIDYKFFWTRNEIQISQLIGDQYYLYLLPVISKTDFDIEKLQIIKNPYKNVFENNFYKKSEEVYCIERCDEQ